MTIARIPLTYPLASRTASTQKDSRVVNGLFESSGDTKRVVKRPGMIKQNFGLPVSPGRGLFTWDRDIIVAQTSSLYRVEGQTPILLGTITGTLPVSFAETGADAYLALHDGASLYTVDKPTKTLVSPSGAVSSVNIDTAGGYYGYSTSCTVAAGTPPTITKTAHGLVVGQGITFTATTLPAGITLGTTYQVASVPTADTFTINTATTGGGAGAAVAVTTTGTAVKYMASPTVTFSAGAPTATGVATLYNHQVRGVIVTATGTYTSLPTVTFSNPAAGTTAVANMNYSNPLHFENPYQYMWFTQASLSNAGVGYLSAPHITFSGSGLGDNATGYTVLAADGTVSKIVITSQGKYRLPNNAELGVGNYPNDGTVSLDTVTASIEAPTTTTAAGTVVMASGGITGPFASGIEYLDGYVFVLTKAGRIYQSDLEDPTTWGALNFIEVNADPDSGVALARQLNYLVAFGEWSTEIFYNAGNPTGSVLGNNKSAKMEIGCASGPSVAKAEHTLVWMGQSKTEGRAIYMMEGLSPVKVSNKYVEKYLNDSLLAEVYSYCFKIAGHTLYVLTLEVEDITLVYDLDEKEWYQWTTSNPTDVQIAVLPSGAGSIAFPPTNVHVGDMVYFSSITPGTYTTTLETYTPYYATYVSTSSISISDTPGGAAISVGPAGQPLGFFDAVLQNEGFFQFTAFNGNIEYSPALYFQHHHDGQIYIMSPEATSDELENIYFRVVTNIQDSGTTKRKFYIRAELVGDKVVGTAYIRHTSDDYQTWSKYRSVDLSATRSILYQLGQSRRRAWEVVVTDNVPVRLEAIELDFDVGEIGAS